jgi:hypothetical protein
VLVIAMFLAGGRAWGGGFFSEAEAALSLTSGTIQPVTNFNATGGCGLLILGPKADLTWTASPSTWATGYRIERWRNGTLQQTYLVPGAATTSYTVTGLSGNTTYDFKIFTYRNSWLSSSLTDPASTPLLCL